jgi:hypothetical protein
MMTTHYRDGDTLITSAVIRANGHDLRQEEILRVWHQRGRRSWSTIAGRGMIGVAMITPILVGGLGIVIALLIKASAPTTIALLGGGILVGLAAAPLADVLLDRVDRSYDRGSRSLEIWARTPAGNVLLLRTRDAQRFGRIYRALQRALEPAHR